MIDVQGHSHSAHMCYLEINLQLRVLLCYTISFSYSLYICESTTVRLPDRMNADWKHTAPVTMDIMGLLFSMSIVNQC